jgi:hypothetical protein
MQALHPGLRPGFLSSIDLRVSETSAVAENNNWDQFDDGYFTDADLAEMRAEAIQVRSTCALAARTADTIALSSLKGTTAAADPLASPSRTTPLSRSLRDGRSERR